MTKLLPMPPVAILLLILSLLGIVAWAAVDWFTALPRDALERAAYVGRPSCVDCHAKEASLWTGSHHDRAMEIANETSVLGDFNDVRFTRHGVTTRFFRRGDKYMVNAEAADGALRDFEIKYTFGVDPLQQYMVEFADGRLQVLRESWDVHKRQWFFVAPEDAADMRIEPGDPLHWTGLGQNWNTMCAECHSTDLRPNYDLKSNAYHTSFREIDVSCEMCHGPGSVHVELASSNRWFWDRRHGYGLVHKLKGATTEKQLETCAPCHSRRTAIHPEYHAGKSYLDYFEPALLSDGLYHADGQILDEVYVYGSFQQSKMYSKGVRCTDCHDPHSLKLKFEGNQLCAQCHQPGKYDTPNHHRHKDAAASLCVNCHMPTRTYMGIDDRRDHSLRVPRPDLSVELGTPNACNNCHVKPTENAAWAAEAVVRWYGNKRPDDPHYAHAIDAGRRQEPQGDSLLFDLLERPQVPQIVRATAVELLAKYRNQESLDAIRKALQDSHPLVRAAAVRAYPLPPSKEEIAAYERSDADNPAPTSMRNSRAKFVNAVAPLLNDSVRVVRQAAASRMAATANDLANSMDRDQWNKALDEYRSAQSLHLDRAAAHMNLTQLSLQLASAASDRDDVEGQRKEFREAVESLRHAVRLEHYLTGPRALLASTLEQVAASPELADLAVELQAEKSEIDRLRRAEADNLARDQTLVPNAPDLHYRRGMLMYLLADVDEARREITEACRLGPNDYDNWLALVLICQKQERWQDAVDALQKMLRIRPQDPTAQQIFHEMRQSMAERGIELQVVPKKRPPE